MKETLRVLNQLESQGLLSRYSIGGAIAALFYMDPFETEDLDILILLPSETAQRLDALSPFYEHLRVQGFKEDGPYVIIHGIPVQFLPAYKPLVVEAVHAARETAYEDVSTRVLTPEYLAAIMLDTGRAKDRARFTELREQTSLDEERLEQMVKQYGLTERFEQWTKT